MSRWVSRLVVATAAVFVASACASATDVQTDLDVRLSLDRTLIGELQPVTITITIVNHGSQPADQADGRGALPVATGRYRIIARVFAENRTLESAPVWMRVFDLASTRIP